MPLTKEVVNLILGRRSLLWVLQRFDLKTDENVHDYRVLFEEARVRYRNEVLDSDKQLADFYWESIWLEGGKNNILKVIHQTREKLDYVSRVPVVLASEFDSKADISTANFLPIYVLPGLLDKTVVKSSQYGVVSSRQRERIAWDLASKLRAYSGRVLFVIGAKQANDYDFLFDVLNDSLVVDLHIVLVGEVIKDLQLPDNKFIKFLQYHEGLDALLEEFRTFGAPNISDVPTYSLRYGNSVMDIGGIEFNKIVEQFNVVLEKDLAFTSEVTFDDFTNFLDSDLENWNAFSNKVPVERLYTVDGVTKIEDEIVKSANEMSGKDKKSIVKIIQLPSEGGAGATTLLRSAAFAVATQGFPALFLKQDPINIDIDALLAFITFLQDRAMLLDAKVFKPAVIFFDNDHTDINYIKKIPQILMAHGKVALVVRCVDYDESKHKDYAKNKSTTVLRPLLSKTIPGEVDLCCKHFQDVVARWNLPLSIPSTDDWRLYEKNMEWISPSKANEVMSLFWVALRFFLIEGSDQFIAQDLPDVLGGWIRKRIEGIGNSKRKDVLNYLAVLSSYRIVCPMWTLLRPVTGGRFSTEITDFLKEISDFVIWGKYNIEIEDYLITFKHPQLAEEILRQQGVVSSKEKLELLSPLFSSLSVGSKADMWIAKILIVYVIAPKSDYLAVDDRDWRLSAFESLPEIISASSKVILHHWARCLYQSVSHPVYALLESQDRAYYNEAFIKLRRALDLPRTIDRDEHPSQLYNTLGTAYSRYANFLSELNSDNREVQEAWKNAYDAFENGLKYTNSQDVKALLTFSYRILSRVEGAIVSDKLDNDQANDLLYCINLLDLAQDQLNSFPYQTEKFQENINELKTKALYLLKRNDFDALIEKLKMSSVPEAGFYCQARAQCNDLNDKKSVGDAISLLLPLFEGGGLHTPKSLIFLLLLIRNDAARRYDFELIYNIYRKLGMIDGYVFRQIDIFRFAVACYQLSKFDEGKEKFRILRSQIRKSEYPSISVRDYWIGSNHKPRIATIRIVKYLSEWRAEGYVEELRQNIPVRPRHFEVIPKLNDIIQCIIRFESNGPVAVPMRFFKQ